MLSYAQTSEIYQTAKSIISDFEIPNIALANYSVATANYSVATADDGVATAYDVSDSSDSLTFQNFTYTVDNSQVTITGYTGEETEITVPSEIDGMKVTTIGGSAFSGKPLTNIIIQEGVTTIKYGAFSRCTALKNITLPESLTEIGNQVFEECSALESIIIPDGVTAIEWNTFYKCSSLQSVVLPEGLTFIGMDAFYSCKSLQSVVLPKDLKTIGAAAFESCIALESITLPEGLTLIEFNAFLFCKSLKSIIIPDSVTRIEHDAFSNCTALESVKLPKGLTLIESGLFNKCKSLKSITIPESVTNIKSSAFKGSGLESITIPEGITLISTDLFYECESLTSVKFPESLTSIAEGAFYYCLALESITIPKGVTTIENCTFYQCKSLTSITLPEGVKNIGNYAFYQCIDLEAIYMPYSMEEIGTGVFMESPNVTMYVYKDTVSEQYAIDNNIPYQYRDYIDAIVILPGIMGSRLFFNNDLYYEGSIVWEPISKGVTTTDGIQQTVYNLKKLDSYLSDENRDSNFTVKPPQNQQFLKIHEESEEAYGLEYREYGALNTYKDLIDDLCESTDRPVYLFNYDWTKSNADSADKLKEFLEPFDHVDLICHSMGGIVASNYMSKYKSDGKIDRIVTCGTPYEGSPVMINKMMNWDILENDDADAFLSMDKDRVMNVFSDVALGLVGGLSKEAKLSIISTSELFPTENYVLRVPFYKKEDVLSFDEYKAICSDIYEKVGRDYNDAISFQESIKGSTGYNNLLDYDKSYFLMGTNQKTITSVVFKKDDISSTSHEDDLGYDDLGDGTVPYYSLTMCKKLWNCLRIDIVLLMEVIMVLLKRLNL